MVKKLLSALGLDKKSKYVNDYFYSTNMRASIYMSIVVIILEVWMIIRMTRTIVENNLYDRFWNLFEKYYSNYFLLLGAGVLMLLFAVRFLTGKQWLRWLIPIPAAFCGAVAVFELWMLTKYNSEQYTPQQLHNFLINLTAAALLIAFSFVFISHKKDKKWQGLTVMYIFSFVCINFGIIISENSYAKGEQILTFLTMELFVVCLLTWRPIVGFAILTVSYLVFFNRLDNIVAFNTGEIGLTESTLINGFTMWISTLMFCISNYNKTKAQALKDENLEKINSYLSRISVEDELTGIHNMVHFRTEGEKLLSYVTTDRDNIIFLFFDIENFKSYNEKYGFHKGNELLKDMAQSMVEVFPGSLVSRYSDDHFVVLTRYDGCMEAVNKLSVRVKELQGEVQLSLKCGGYRPAGEEKDISLACDRARFACNSVKKHFDRSFRMYDKILEDRFTLKQYIVNNIDNAIDNDYIRVYYQPVVSTENGCICGFEALARWQDPVYGLLPPGVFIEVLEEYRQIHKLDKRIIELVCRDYRAAHDNELPFVPVSLNFSRLDFELCDIVGYLTQCAEKYDVPKAYLDVEITESALTEQQDFLQNAIKKLRGSGYKIWLDDFGSGYSSLNVLQDYHFDVMKIDMKFLAGFGSNNKTSTILKNIVGLTQQLGMVSLTEGVESEEQFAFLKDIGCNRAQGYLFSKPVPYEKLMELISVGKLAVAPEYRSA